MIFVTFHEISAPHHQVFWPTLHKQTAPVVSALMGFSSNGIFQPLEHMFNRILIRAYRTPLQNSPIFCLEHFLGVFRCVLALQDLQLRPGFQTMASTFPSGILWESWDFIAPCSFKMQQSCHAKNRIWTQKQTGDENAEVKVFLSKKKKTAGLGIARQGRWNILRTWNWVTQV